MNSPTDQLTRMLQKGLEENPYYHYACRLRQLDPIDVTFLAASGVSGWQVFERRRLAEGLRAGEIKPTALDLQPGWDDVFAPFVQGSVGRAAMTADSTGSAAQRG